jgi:dihydropteroate synthase
MQDQPRYHDVVGQVRDHLIERAETARAAGVREIWIDPGIGFGKTYEHNLALLGNIDVLVATGLPVVVGTSRKGFLGRLLAASDDVADPVPTDDRLEGSLATATWALARGVAMVRAHDVRPTAQAVRVAAAPIAEQRREQEHD